MTRRVALDPEPTSAIRVCSIDVARSGLWLLAVLLTAPVQLGAQVPRVAPRQPPCEAISNTHECARSIEAWSFLGLLLERFALLHGQWGASLLDFEKTSGEYRRRQLA